MPRCGECSDATFIKNLRAVRGASKIGVGALRQYVVL